MSPATVKVQVEDNIARLTLARPEVRNALSIELCNHICEGLAEIRDGDARVVIVEGEGSVFCSGADFAAVSGPGAIEFLPAFEQMLEEVARFPLPTIARIQGAALGGGLQLATVCDFRVAASSAKIGIPSARLGIVVNLENVERLVLLVGPAAAKEILMTARVFSGSEAQRIGLLGGVADDEDALDREVDALARSIADLAPRSVRGAKRAIALIQEQLSAARHRAPADAAQIDRLVADAYGSGDLAEGIRAMQEKRPPRFTGR